MRARLFLFTALFTALFTVVLPLAAHHSFDAEFDRAKPISISGTVTKVEWMNPHIWVYLDVTGDDGKIAKWQFEGGAPNGLRRQGWSRNSLKIGDMVSIDGWRAKDGSNTINARAVVLSDGKQLFAGSSGGDEKNK